MTDQRPISPAKALLIQLRGSLQALVLIAERKRDPELVALVDDIVRLTRALDELVRW